MAAADPPRQIEVLLRHPHGDVWVPLEEWMRTGPGPRPGLRPHAARDKDTKRPLPTSVIPLAYRNTWLSRALKRLRLVSPWPG